MPSQLHNFTIFRSLTWQGLRCMALNSTGDAVQLEGTALLQARKAPSKPVAFELPVTLGDEDGEILIPEVSATSTAALPLGEFEYDLILIDTDSKPWPPVIHGTITVKDPISRPDVS